MVERFEFYQRNIIRNIFICKVKSGIFLSLGLCMTTSIRTVRKSTEGRSTQRKCPISNCYYYITYLYLYILRGFQTFFVGLDVIKEVSEQF